MRTLSADETTAPVLNLGRGRTKTGRLWADARDDHPCGGGDPPMVAYVYAADRKADRAEAHFGNFAGILQGKRCSQPTAVQGMSSLTAFAG